MNLTPLSLWVSLLVVLDGIPLRLSEIRPVTLVWWSRMTRWNVNTTLECCDRDDKCYAVNVLPVVVIVVLILVIDVRIILFRRRFAVGPQIAVACFDAEGI